VDEAEGEILAFGFVHKRSGNEIIINVLSAFTKLLDLGREYAYMKY